MNKPQPTPCPALRVDVVETDGHASRGWEPCAIGRHIRFSTEGLESYCLASWQPIVYDLLVLAAGVEFCDKARPRARYKWGRSIELCVPVHDPARWQTPAVSGSLHSALEFLTGDRWDITFRARTTELPSPEQSRFRMPIEAAAVIPYSDGLDSRAVAALVSQSLGRGLIRVSLGSSIDAAAIARRQPFASVPYRVTLDTSNRESSGRSRGFKFTLMAGIAAYLAGVTRVIMSESLQGALGPALVTVAHSYEDYRNHPLFTERMAVFLKAILGQPISFEYPRLWSTKAETIQEFVAADPASDWRTTRSCWQQSRQASVNGQRRQCGICAACLLRRMSVQAAGLVEDASTYVWEDLSASEFSRGASPQFDPDKITGAMREYAIAAALHLDHLAELNQSAPNAETLTHTAYQLASTLAISEVDVTGRLNRAIDQHRQEWRLFLDAVGSDSFLSAWAKGGRS